MKVLILCSSQRCVTQVTKLTLVKNVAKIVAFKGSTGSGTYGSRKDWYALVNEDASASLAAAGASSGQSPYSGSKVQGL